ncbi:MAG: hypothetical protein DHS20C16_14480 [Phycisphaerae bacterium]|nr:MAG: hypothetical protein DHS20C16_14480 [Phycisphaerae bacterium]
MLSVTRIALAVLVVVTMVASIAAAPLTIEWFTVDDGGGQLSSGGSLKLSATVGQPDVGTASGGGLRLTGGFWFAVSPGDCDFDGDIDQHDHDDLANCLLGPSGGIATDCSCLDVDQSGSVDLKDFALFQNWFVS